MDLDDFLDFEIEDIVGVVIGIAVFLAVIGILVAVSMLVPDVGWIIALVLLVIVVVGAVFALRKIDFDKAFKKRRKRGHSKRNKYDRRMSHHNDRYYDQEYNDPFYEDRHSGRSNRHRSDFRDTSKTNQPYRDMVDCFSCGTTQERTNRFCLNCGQKVRA